MVKGSLLHEDIAFLNAYEANDKAENMEAKTDRNERRNRYFTIVFEDFNTSFSNC